MSHNSFVERDRIQETSYQKRLLTMASATRARSKSTYNEDSIEVLRGLEGVRRKPGMYLGELGDQMIWRMSKELVDNCTDEAMAGRNSFVELVIDNKTNTYIVADKAEGIPVGIKAGHKVSALTLIFTELHAGGKFNDRAYKAAAGTHGIGSSAVNAVSKSFEVWTNRDNKWHYQAFSCGKPLAVLKSGVKLPADLTSKFSFRPKNGTIIRFVPDLKIVSDGETRPKLNVQQALSWLQGIADLNTGLTVVLSVNGKRKTMLNKDGPKRLLTQRVKTLGVETMGKSLVFEDDKTSFAIQWTSHTDDDGLLSYVSCSPTKDGGTHVNGFKAALVKAVGAYKKPSDKFLPADIMFGLAGVFNWRMSEPAFSSQVKDKLVSNVTKEVHDKLLPMFTEFFKKNQALARRIIKRAADIKKIKEQQKKMLEGAAAVKSKSRGVVLPGILTQANCSPDERELYIVEGDSAAGLAKLVRERDFQEIMRAKGKPVNCLKNTLAKCLANSEVQNFLIATGLNPATFKTGTVDYDSLRIKSLNFLADADVDGAHINLLLLAFVYKFMPKMIDQGRVFVIDAPLFNAYYRGARFYGNSVEEVKKMLPQNATGAQIMRSKGWGEISKEVLYEVAFNPETRRRIRVAPVHGKELEALIGLVGEDIAARQKLLGV